MKSLSIELMGENDFGPCECCGAATRRVWGGVHAPDRIVASYFVQWTLGKVVDHGALFELVLGRWGEVTSAEDRVLVALQYWLSETGPAFMVIDSKGRLADDRALVIGQPIASEAFAVARSMVRLALFPRDISRSLISRGDTPYSLVGWLDQVNVLRLREQNARPLASRERSSFFGIGVYLANRRSSIGCKLGGIDRRSINSRLRFSLIGVCHEEAIVCCGGDAAWPIGVG